MSEYIYNTAAKEATAFTKQRNAAFAREFQIDLEDAYNSEVALARRGCLKKLDGRHSTLEITRKVFFYGVVTLLPVFAFTPLRFDTALFRNPVVAGNLLFLGLVASLFCFAVWNTAVKHLGTVKTSNYIYLVPLVALISSAIVLNERITPVALGGAVLILGGVYIAENGRHIRGLKPIHR